MSSRKRSAVMKKPTLIEKLAGNPVTEGALTLVAASGVAASGSFLAPLLPVLSNALAAGRHRERVENAITVIDRDLQAVKDTVRDLSDSQYKLISETILTLLQTVNPAKIAYLRQAVRNTLRAPALLPEDPTLLARILRDVSVEEAEFLVRNAEIEGLVLQMPSGESRPGTLCIAPDSADGRVITGLISLGLLRASTMTYGGSMVWRFSPLVAQLVELLCEPAE